MVGLEHNARSLQACSTERVGDGKGDVEGGEGEILGRQGRRLEASVREANLTSLRGRAGGR